MLLSAMSARLRKPVMDGWTIPESKGVHAACSTSRKARVFVCRCAACVALELVLTAFPSISLFFRLFPSFSDFSLFDPSRHPVFPQETNKHEANLRCFWVGTRLPPHFLSATAFVPFSSCISRFFPICHRFSPICHRKTEGN